MRNLVILLGRLGKTPEQSHTNGGLEVSNFSLATGKKIKNKTTGDYTEVTQWHRCKAFGKTAEFINKHFDKGSSMYLEGEIQYSEYEKDGVKKYSTDILVNTVSFSGDKKE